eukprot:scaffold71702_cov25-Cyclotella_meneghiniana.AAC.5
MKLTIATTSIAALCTPSVSSSIVAASIRKHESKQGSIRSSASKKKESTSIAALWTPSDSSSIVAASIHEYESKQGSSGPSDSKQKECAFEDGFKVNLRKSSDVVVPPCEIGELCAEEYTTLSHVGIQKSSEDVGILSCEIGELCEEDLTSSLGGRCVAASGNNVARNVWEVSEMAAVTNRHVKMSRTKTKQTLDADHAMGEMPARG